MAHKFYKLLPPLFFVAFFLLSSKVSAATFLLSAKSESAAIDDRVEVDIKIDSEDVGFNAAQATIQFSKDILEVAEIDQSGSVFNFWLEEPSFSNEDGKIDFIGGATTGYVGKSLQILKVIFKVRGGGTASLVFTDGAITASDGSGTNILSAMRGIKIVSVPKQEIQEIIKLTKPVQIVREPTPAADRPQKPVIEVALYPRSNKWHNLSFPFFVSWELPSDVTDVSAALNQRPEHYSTKSEGLFESKQFPPLEDGIWYIHTRFRNNVGWGPPAQYRLAIDTVPPAAFTLTVVEETATDNPQPTISYQSGDALSGLDYYEIRVDGQEPIITLEEIYTLPPQPPGKHFLRVRAVDRAGNAAENNFELEILPIVSPVITSISRDVFTGEGGLEAAGTALPGVSVLLSLKHRSGRFIYSDVIVSDEEGNWETKIDQPLKKGKYFIEVIAQDARKALSLPVKSHLIKVRESPILTIGVVEITQFWFFVGLLVILIAGFAGGWFSYRLWKARVGRRVIIAQRDVVTVFNFIEKDINKMLGLYENEKVGEHEIAEIKYLLKRAKANLGKTRRYIVENIEEISD